MATGLPVTLGWVFYRKGRIWNHWQNLNRPLADEYVGILHSLLLQLFDMFEIGLK